MRSGLATAAAGQCIISGTFNFNRARIKAGQGNCRSKLRSLASGPGPLLREHARRAVACPQGPENGPDTYYGGPETGGTVQAPNSEKMSMIAVLSSLIGVVALAALFPQVRGRRARSTKWRVGALPDTPCLQECRAALPPGYDEELYCPPVRLFSGLIAHAHQAAPARYPNDGRLIGALSSAATA